MKAKENNIIKPKKINDRHLYMTEEQREIKKFIIIILIVSVVIGGIYLITEKFVNKGATENAIPGSINYDVTSVGAMLNRPYTDYYVIIYNSKDVNASIYSSIVTKYSNNEEATKVYYVDLAKGINKPYYNINNDNKSNASAKDIESIDLGDLTLIKVANGKIVKYIENVDTITNELQ